MFTLSTFYKSREWEDLIKILKIERVNSEGVLICEHCGKPIIKSYDCIGHHKEELTEANVNDRTVSLNPDNIALVHHQCHNAIHERFGHDGTRHIYLVYGAPGAGKRAYVEAAAGRDDLILDLDSLYAAITLRDRYDHSNRVSRNVFGLRDCILDQIKTRAGKWRSAWVIGGYPLSSERSRLCEMLGAEPVYIDTPQSECLLTCKDRGYDYLEYCVKWFDSYTV